MSRRRIGAAVAVVVVPGRGRETIEFWNLVEFPKLDQTTTSRGHSWSSRVFWGGVKVTLRQAT